MKKEIIKSFNIDNDFYIDDIFVFTNEKNNYSFLLNKNGCSIIIDLELLNEIKTKKPSENLKFKLIQHGLAGLRKSKISISEEENNNIYFIIDVTKKCNFNCLYCFRNLDDNRVIEDDKLQDICSYILNITEKRNLKNVTVQIWGGEPLLALDKIEFVYNFFKNTHITLNIDIETNGSLITDKIAKKLFDMNVKVGVSIDGTRKHQDIQRRLINDLPSSQLVTRGVKNLKKYYGNNIGGITVVTKYNYNEIIDIIEYFTKELEISSMKFNIVRDNPNAVDDKVGLSLDEVRFFANKLFDVVVLYNFLGIKFNEGNIEVRINNLKERNRNNYCLSNGCKGGINLLSIDMNGDIYPCEMTDYKDVKIGSIYKDGKLSSNTELINQINKSKKSNIYFQEKGDNNCKKCPWQYFCKGGCTSRILYSEGKMKYDEVECEFNKVIYERIVDDMLKKLRVVEKNG